VKNVLLILVLCIGSSAVADEGLMLMAGSTNIDIGSGGNVQGSYQQFAKVRDYTGYKSPNLPSSEKREIYIKNDGSGRAESVVYVAETSRNSMKSYVNSKTSIELKDGKVVSQISCDYEGSCRTYTISFCDNILAASGALSWQEFAAKKASCSAFEDSYKVALYQQGMDQQLEEEFSKHVKKIESATKVGNFTRLFGSSTKNKAARDKDSKKSSGNEVALNDMSEVVRVCGGYGAQDAWNAKALPKISFVGRAAPTPAPSSSPVKVNSGTK
jgi:hypothetical protein